MLSITYVPVDGLAATSGISGSNISDLREWALRQDNAYGLKWYEAGEIIMTHLGEQIVLCEDGAKFGGMVNERIGYRVEHTVATHNRTIWLNNRIYIETPFRTIWFGGLRIRADRNPTNRQMVYTIEVYPGGLIIGEMFGGFFFDFVKV